MPSTKGASEQTNRTEKGVKAWLNADSETPTSSKLGWHDGVLEGVETALLLETLADARVDV